MNIGSEESRCGLLLDVPRAGDWNMALDAWLLEEAVRRQTPCLRFYSWAVPTLSLGYFQAYEDRLSHSASLSVPVVRRETGGGAILHDRELTYSFALPREHSLATDAQGLYLRVHGLLVEALSDLGVTALLREAVLEKGSVKEPFLCFQRASLGDVLCDGRKIAGSAQRRRREGTLLHGSVLLDHSEWAPELVGIAQLGGGNPGYSDLLEAWLEYWQKGLGLSLFCLAPPCEECADIDRFVSDFRESDWLNRR